MENKLELKLYLDLRENGVVQPDGTYSSQNYRDYYVNINLNRNFKLIEPYVDIQLDPLRVDMQRQLINPWFIEFGFFESIKTTGITGKTSNNLNVLVPSIQNLIKKADNFSITINR